MSASSSKHVRFVPARDRDKRGDNNDDDDDDNDDNDDRRRQRRHRHEDEEMDAGAADVDLSMPLSETQLQDMFFGPKRHFKRTSDELGEFPDFYAKYQRAQAMQAAKRATAPAATTTTPPELSDAPFDVPRDYHQRYRLNFSVFGAALPSHLRHHEIQYKEFRESVHFFEDFLQRKRFAQLQKTIQDRKNLPIFPYRDEIIQTVRDHAAVIIAGDTGCGKSTQVPQYLMEAGFVKESLNVHGSKIAYQVRFETTAARDTRILFLTEGSLLRYLLSDPLLIQFNVIIVDEVHERHITSDFTMAALKAVLLKRPSLKLVLMSATINSEMFSKYLNDAPIIKIPGRMYPVAVEYVPTEEDLDLLNDKHYQERLQHGLSTSVLAKPIRINSEPYLKILERIDQEYPSTQRGDLLVFLSGMYEITYLAEELKPYASYTKRWIILMLHSSLSVEEQDKVFDIAPDGVRKCILSTNIAETSVTIDGIRFIIDSGRAKEMGHDPEMHMMKLQEFWVSKASAQQRAGRAGRTGPGKCFRLFSQREFEHLNPYAVPEIMRVPLQSLVLQIKSFGFGNPRTFDLIQKPPLDVIEGCVEFLKLHSALTDNEQITPLGYTIALLPVDFILAKMLLMGIVFDLVDPVLTLTAALSVSSPIVRLSEADIDISKRRQEFSSEHGDAFTLLNIVDEWIAVKANKEPSKQWCRRYGLEEQRLYEIIKLKRQFETILIDSKLLSERDNASFFERKRNQGNRDDVDVRAQRRLMQQARIAQSSRKRKLLRFEDDHDLDTEVKEKEKQQASSSSLDLTTIDIRDLDFHLTHDIGELQANAQAYKQFSTWEINLLKIILCSGLYPNIAIADEGNMNRRDSDLVFHTAKKRFILLHPTSIFNAQPGLVSPKRVGDESQSAELLCYLQMLETNKTYLMTLQRLPALPTCLLFARQLETDLTGTRLLVDNWLEINFATAQSAGEQLIVSHRFRRLWGQMLQRKIEESTKHIWRSTSSATMPFVDLSQALGSLDGELTSQEPTAAMPELLPFWVTQIRKDLHYTQSLTSIELSRKMCEFFESRASYRIDVVRAEDVERVYRARPVSSISQRREGLQVNSYIRFGSIEPVANDDIRAKGFLDHMLKWFKCPICSKEAMVDRSRLIAHLDECQQRKAQGATTASSSSSSVGLPAPEPVRPA